MVGSGIFEIQFDCERSFRDKKRQAVAMGNLQNEIGNLSTAEKFDLLDALWQSLEADDLSLTDVQRDELDNRLAQYERNQAEVIPWEQVRANLFKEQ